MNRKTSMGLLAFAVLVLMATSPTVAAAEITVEVDADTGLLPTEAMGGSSSRQAIKVCVYDTVSYCGEGGYLWATAEGPWGCISTWLQNPLKGC